MRFRSIFLPLFAGIIGAAVFSGVIDVARRTLASQYTPPATPVTGSVTGLALSNNINAALAAVQSANSGNSAPNSPTTGQLWLNTTSNPNVLAMYDGTGWNTIAWLDTSAHLWTSNSGGGTGTIASMGGGTTDIGTVLNPVISVTGTNTISSFGSTAITGTQKFLNFTGILTLTHNGTSLILPNNGSNIVTAAGDTVIAEALGSGNWRVISYQRATGGPVSTSNLPVLLNIMTSAIGGGGALTFTDTTSFTGTYKFYDLVFLNVTPVSNGTHCEIQVQSSATIQTTGYLGVANIANAAPGQVTTYVPCSYTNGNVLSANSGISGTITVFNPSNASNQTTFNGQVTAITTGPVAQIVNVGGQWNTAAAITGVQIFMTTGNITGTVYVYGRN